LLLCDFKLTTRLCLHFCYPHRGCEIVKVRCNCTLLFILVTVTTVTFVLLSPEYLAFDIEHSGLLFLHGVYNFPKASYGFTNLKIRKKGKKAINNYVFVLSLKLQNYQSHRLTVYLFRRGWSQQILPNLDVNNLARPFLSVENYAHVLVNLMLNVLDIL